MSPRFQKKQARHLASGPMEVAYKDFILSRQMKRCTPMTMQHYERKLTEFLLWLEDQDIRQPENITTLHIYEFLAGKREKYSDYTCHGYARVIRTFVRHAHENGFIPRLLKFDMPKLSKKRLPVLNEEQLRRVIQAANVRDRAIVMLMADTGLRNSEVCALNWGDVNFDNGIIRVRQGKGQKDRTVVCGAATRRALLAYRRTLSRHDENDPLFQARYNHHYHRLGRTGLLLIYKRLSEITKIHVTPHAMRRTFVLLALRRGMDVGIIQAMLGHTTLDMVYAYAQLDDTDMIREHRKSGPVDDLF